MSGWRARCTLAALSLLSLISFRVAAAAPDPEAFASSNAARSTTQVVELARAGASGDLEAAALQPSCGAGGVIQLEDSSHLWILDQDLRMHWAGDTRALVGRTVDWNCRITGRLTEVRLVPRGDPWLSTGLVKIGELIYLAKWETDQPRPTLLHVQSIRDLELFGIDGSNYTRFVLDAPEWERTFGIALAELPRSELASIVPRLPRVAAPREDVTWSCLAANPSCSRNDPWWVEWDEVQSSELSEFSFAPGLVAEARYTEAIWLIWRWPEGRTLLQEAGLNGVWILTFPPEWAAPAYAMYSDAANALVVNRRFTETSTWLVADVLVHELQHAIDDRRGEFRGGGYARCILEQRAYAQEASFLRWLTGRMGGFPAATQVQTRLSAEDYQLFRDAVRIASAPDPRLAAVADYPHLCSGGPGS